MRLNELFTSGDLGGDWEETPDGVKDSHTGEPSKLPIQVPAEFREDNKKKKKRKKKKLKESRTSERQSKFANEHLSGIDQFGKQLVELSDIVKDKESEINSDMSEDEKKQFIQEYRELRDGIEEQISVVWTILSIKLNTAIGHALNGDAVGPIKKIIGFMDKYGINDEIFISGITQVANTRRVNGGFLDLCAVIAARNNDVQFIKDLEKFIEKNKDRRSSIFSKEHESNMGTFGLQKITQKNRIALEALISGSEEVYNYITNGKGIDKDYLITFIKKEKTWWAERLNKNETANVIGLGPDGIFDVIQEEMPENLPQDILDIFIF